MSEQPRSIIGEPVSRIPKINPIEPVKRERAIKPWNDYVPLVKEYERKQIQRVLDYFEVKLSAFKTIEEKLQLLSKTVEEVYKMDNDEAFKDAIFSLAKLPKAERDNFVAIFSKEIEETFQNIYDGILNSLNATIDSLEKRRKVPIQSEVPKEKAQAPKKKVETKKPVRKGRTSLGLVSVLSILGGIFGFGAASKTMEMMKERPKIESVKKKTDEKTFSSSEKAALEFIMSLKSPETNQIDRDVMRAVGDRISEIPPSIIKKLNRYQWSLVTPEQLSKLTKEQITGLDVATFSNTIGFDKLHDTRFSKEKLSALVKALRNSNNLNRFNSQTDALSRLLDNSIEPNQQIAFLNENGVRYDPETGFYIKQLYDVTPDLSSEDIIAGLNDRFNTEALKQIDSRVFLKVKPRDMQKLDLGIVNHLTIDQIRMFSKDQLARLKDSEFELLKPEYINKLGAEFFSGLPEWKIMALLGHSLGNKLQSMEKRVHGAKYEKLDPKVYQGLFAMLKSEENRKKVSRS